MGVFKELDIAMNEYAEHLIEDYGRPDSDFKVDFIPGNKFIKVAVGTNGNRSCHSFIVIQPHGAFAFGDILKAATWKAPAKNFARGNVLTGDFKSIRWCGI